MEKLTGLIGCILLVSSHAYAVDLPNDESTQFQFQEEVIVQHQARVDSDGIPAMLQAMQQYQFRHENVVRVRSMIEDSQQQGLPADPMMHKVYEGMAKKIKEENIVRAVKQVQERYETAYRQAKTLTKDSQLAKQLGEVIAEAYTAGLKEEDCAQIMSQLQVRARTINMQEANELMVQTMATARVMARRGVDSASASDVLVGALQHAYQAREMRTLQNVFIEQVRYGSPEDVARDFSVEIGRNVDASELRVRSTDGGFGGGQSGSGASGGSGSSGGS
ncbi:MAG: hypothetical protein KKD01_02335, partial [Proteobacteria bacterium]|nr:hypothetical protein [Pseudomonadota bacterium]